MLNQGRPKQLNIEKTISVPYLPQGQINDHSQRPFRTLILRTLFLPLKDRGTQSGHMYRAPTDFRPLRRIFVHFCGLPAAFMLH